MNIQELVTKLEKMDACKEAIKWVEQQKNPYTAWRKCPDGEWLEWVVSNLYAGSKKRCDRTREEEYDREVQQMFNDFKKKWCEKYGYGVYGTMPDKGHDRFREKVGILTRKNFTWREVKAKLEKV